MSKIDTYPQINSSPRDAQVVTGTTFNAEKKVGMDVNVLNQLDVTHQKNWMTEGVICSELVWHFLDRLGPKFSEAVKHLNPDTTNAEDILKVVRSRSDLFKPIETNPKAEAEFLQWVHQNS